MAVIVKNFWTKPSDIPLSAKNFIFGYTDQKGKDFEYKAEVKNGDTEAFHKFVFAILASKKKKLLPWVTVRGFKNKVTITSTKEEAVQMELPLKVARNYINRL